MKPGTSLIRRQSGPTFHCTATCDSLKYVFTLMTVRLVGLLVLALSFFGQNIFQTTRSTCHKQSKYTVKHNTLLSRNSVPHKYIIACYNTFVFFKLL